MALSLLGRRKMLKLQNSPHVRYATLGDIEVWNWFDQ